MIHLGYALPFAFSLSFHLDGNRANDNRPGSRGWGRWWWFRRCPGRVWLLGLGGGWGGGRRGPDLGGRPGVRYAVAIATSSSAPALPESLPPVLFLLLSPASFPCSLSYLLLLIVSWHLFVSIKPASFPNYLSLCQSVTLKHWVPVYAVWLLSVFPGSFHRFPCMLPSVMNKSVFESLLSDLQISPCHSILIPKKLRLCLSLLGLSPLCWALRSFLCLSAWPALLCVSLRLLGSENRRNKLQGVMSDFPSKPASPPSVAGQARSSEGKILIQSIDPYLLNRPCVVSSSHVVCPKPINPFSSTKAGIESTRSVESLNLSSMFTFFIWQWQLCIFTLHL